MRPERLLQGRAVLAASVTLLAVASSTPALAAKACSRNAGPIAPVEIPTLTVAVAADKASYRHGQTAIVPVEVRRPDGAKIAEAQVKVTISAGDVVVKELLAQTDSAGLARPRWTIGMKVPTGKVSAVATASLQIINSYDCSGGLVYATGRGTANPLATINR